MFTKDEKTFLKRLVEEKLVEFQHTSEDEIYSEGPQLLAIEAKYVKFMKDLLKKLKV